MAEQKIVLFLGAGFSCEAYQPTMEQFGSYSDEQLASINNPNKNKEKKAKPLLKVHGEHFQGFRKYCKSADKNSYPFKEFCEQRLQKADFDADNMEHLYMLAEWIDKLYDKAVITEELNIKTPELLKSIRLWLWKIFHRLPLHNPCNEDYRGKVKKYVYKNFVSIIRDYGLEKFTVITTNYDLSLEYICKEKHIKTYYPLCEPTHEDICEAPPNGFFCNPTFEYTPDCLTICKLHGSINFFRKNNENLRVIASIGGKKVGNSQINNKLPTICALDSIYVLYEEKKLIPSFIPPIYDKSQEEYKWIKPTWDHSEKALSEADKWIFIGYSFPVSDTHIAGLVKTALQKRGKDNRPKIIIADPDGNGTVECNYKEALQELSEEEFEENVKICRRKFSEFISEDNFANEIN